MEIEDKITIIEGPPPTFEPVNDGWALGLNEGPSLGEVVLTRLRTYNGQALVERCHRAWRHQHPIHLEFRTSDGLSEQAPIVAARNIGTQEGDVLVLWVRMNSDDVELELVIDDDDEEEDGETGLETPDEEDDDPGDLPDDLDLYNRRV
jgi:hypothetical protein